MQNEDPDRDNFRKKNGISLFTATEQFQTEVGWGQDPPAVIKFE